MLKVFKIILLAGLVAGCATQSQTDREVAVQNWNSARGNVLLTLAHDQFKNGDFDKARESVNQSLAMDPKSAPTHILSARIAIEQNQLEFADAELNAARAITPKLPEADYLSGVIYQRWQQPAKALIFYQHASEEAPDELAYLMAKSETLVSLNRQDEALAILDERADHFEHNPVIHDAMGMILLQQNKLDKAVETFRWALILAPDDVTIREHLSMALFQFKRYGEAAMNLERLVKDDSLAKRADLHLTLAECDVELNRPAEARISAQTAVDLDPSSSAAWLTLAKISLQLGDIRQAEVGVGKALAMEPTSSQAYLLKGYLRLKSNDFVAALEAFKQATQFDQKDTTSLCMTGYVLQKMSRSREAADYYKQALKLDPHDAMATQFMANIAGE
jgi:tetratricopeptide (TPR) repeat protein